MRTGWKAHNDLKTWACELTFNSAWRSTFTKAPKRLKPIRWCSKAGRLSSERSNLGNPNRDKYESPPSSCRTRHEEEGPKAAPSFLDSAQTTFPHVRSHRTRNIQRHHQHRNKLAIRNRPAAKRTRKPPSSHNFMQQTSLGFVLMCMYKCFAIELSQN